MRERERERDRDRDRNKGDLTFNIHFVRQGCGGLTIIAILPQFLTFNIHFVRKGCGE